jgi:hypothetical protein
MQGFLYLAVSFAILFLYRLVKPNQTKRVKKRRLTTVLIWLCTIFLGFIAAGANFSTSLLTVEFFTILLGCAVWIQFRLRKPAWLFLIPYFITLAGFFLNALAPGNAIRQAYYQKSGVLESILLSFSYSFRQALDWIDVFALFCMLLLLPVILRMVSKVSFKFRFPLVVLVISYCLYASMFTPGFYSLGFAPLERNLNICKMFLFILLIANEIYCIGWLLQRFEKMKLLIPTHGKNVAIWIGVICIAAALSLTVFLHSNEQSRKDHFVTYGAWELIYTGIGELYQLEHLTRLNEYVNSTEEIIYVKPYTVFAYPLWINQHAEEPAGYVADWYGKSGIYLGEE